ncbi:hypothetical protein RUND412_008740 [Rhizina undulata]
MRISSEASGNLDSGRLETGSLEIEVWKLEVQKLEVCKLSKQQSGNFLNKNTEYARQARGKFRIRTELVVEAW